MFKFGSKEIKKVILIKDGHTYEAVKVYNKDFTTLKQTLAFPSSGGTAGGGGISSGNVSNVTVTVTYPDLANFITKEREDEFYIYPTISYSYKYTPTGGTAKSFSHTITKNNLPVITLDDSGVKRNFLFTAENDDIANLVYMESVGDNNLAIYQGVAGSSTSDVHNTTEYGRIRALYNETVTLPSTLSESETSQQVFRNSQYSRVKVGTVKLTLSFHDRGNYSTGASYTATVDIYQAARTDIETRDHTATLEFAPTSTIKDVSPSMTGLSGTQNNAVIVKSFESVLHKFMDSYTRKTSTKTPSYTSGNTALMPHAYENSDRTNGAVRAGSFTLTDAANFYYTYSADAYRYLDSRLQRVTRQLNIANEYAANELHITQISQNVTVDANSIERTWYWLWSEKDSAIQSLTEGATVSSYRNYSIDAAKKTYTISGIQYNELYRQKWDDGTPYTISVDGTIFENESNTVKEGIVLSVLKSGDPQPIVLQKVTVTQGVAIAQFEMPVNLTTSVQNFDVYLANPNTSVSRIKIATITQAAAYSASVSRVSGSTESMGSVSRTPTIGTTGTNVTFTATPTSNYNFVGWYSNSEGTGGVISDNPYTTAFASSDISLYAKFDVKLTYGIPQITGVTVADINAAGTNKVSSGTASYTQEGVSGTQTATVTFAEVSGSNLGTTPKERTPIATRKVTVTANGKTSAEYTVTIYQAENKIASTDTETIKAAGTTDRDEWGSIVPTLSYPTNIPGNGGSTTPTYGATQAGTRKTYNTSPVTRPKYTWSSGKVSYGAQSGGDIAGAFTKAVDISRSKSDFTFSFAGTAINGSNATINASTGVVSMSRKGKTVAEGIMNVTMTATNADNVSATATATPKQDANSVTVTVAVRNLSTRAVIIPLVKVGDTRYEEVTVNGGETKNLISAVTSTPYSTSVKVYSDFINSTSIIDYSGGDCTVQNFAITEADSDSGDLIFESMMKADVTFNSGTITLNIKMT